MKKTFKTIAINFMVFSTLIVGIEILGQLAYLIKNGNILLLETLSVHSRVFELHPYLAGRLKSSAKVTQNNKAITITTTHRHTRWTGSQQDDHNLVRIAIMGGSTAFGIGVTDEDSWPALLQAKLGKQYAVINYGVPGYSTAEAIIQMALIVPEIRPHVVIFYEGWNDIRNYHEKDLGSDYYGHGMRQYGNLGIPVIEQQNKIHSFRDTFATFWLLDIINKQITNPTKGTYELFDKPDQFVDSIYIRNLYTLKLLSDNMGAFKVFVPQVLNYARYSGEEGSDAWTRHIKNEAMPTLMDEFNSHMNGLCSQGEQNCVILSGVLQEKWLSDDFVDFGHFSRSGGLKFAEIIAQYIRSEFDSETYEGGTQ